MLLSRKFLLRRREPYLDENPVVTFPLERLLALGLVRTGFHVILVEKSILGFPSESQSRQFIGVIPRPSTFSRGIKTLSEHHTNGVAKWLWTLMTIVLNYLIYLPLTGSFKKSFKFPQLCTCNSLECHSHTPVHLVNPTQHSAVMSNIPGYVVYLRQRFSCLTQTKQLPEE